MKLWQSEPVLDSDSFEGLAVAAGFGASEAARLWPLVQPCLRLLRSDQAGGPESAVEVGGRPWLPKGGAWPGRLVDDPLEPESRPAGHPLSYVATLNLARLAEQPLWNGPDEGHLLLFADFNETYGGNIEPPGGARAVLLPAGIERRQLDPPAELTDDFQMPYAAFAAEPMLTPPHLDKYLVAAAFDWDDERFPELEDLFEREQGFTDLGGFWRAYEEEGHHRPRLQLLGNWLSSHDDPWSFEDDDEEQVPLLQLSPDRHLSQVLDENGRVTFLMPKADFDAQRFDRVEALLLTI